MVTGYEVAYYHHIEQIARSLDRIANCMEAQEKRRREQDEYKPGFEGAALAGAINSAEDLEQWKAGMPENIVQAIQAVKRGFADLERAVQKEGGDGGDHPA